MGSNKEQERDLDEALAELGIVPTSPQDREELRLILHNYLCYPSDSVAAVHAQAFKLGQLDRFENRRKLKEDFIKSQQVPQYCDCCFCFIQPEDLRCTTQIDELETLRESTVLLFVNLRFSIWMMILAFLLFGLYGFITNLTSSDVLCTTIGCDLNRIGLGGKLLVKDHRSLNLYLGQLWLGLVMCCAWVCMFIYKAVIDMNIALQCRHNNPSVTYFTVAIQNCPKELHQPHFQVMLTQYAQKIRKMELDEFLPKGEGYDGKFTIANYNQTKPYYKIIRQQSKEAVCETRRLLVQKKKMLKQLIKNRVQHGDFCMPPGKRQEEYEQIEILLMKLEQEQIKEMENLQEIEQRVERNKFRKTIFLTFNHSYAKANMLEMNKPRWFACIRGKSDTALPLEGVSVSRAPEPEQIIWQNIGISTWERRLRRGITYITCAALLCASFLLIYWLSDIQENNRRSRVISFAISAVITLINLLLTPIIYYLTYLECDYRSTHFQMSVTFKSVTAQLLNSVLLSLLTNYFIKKQNFFNQGGLGEDVFYFSITNAVIPPVIRFLSFENIYAYFRKLYYSRPLKKLKFNDQTEYNRIWQSCEFEIGYEHVYMIKTIIYTAFHISLQPIISLISAFGLLLMYYAQKYALFYKSARPKPGSNLVNIQMTVLMYFSIIAYGLGSLTWSTFVTAQFPKYYMIPSIIAGGLGVFLSLLPTNFIMRCFHKNKPLSQLYEQERLWFSSQYDRINPNTSQKAIVNYQLYLKNCLTNLNFPAVASTTSFGKIPGADADKFISKYINKPIIGTQFIMPRESFLVSPSHSPRRNNSFRRQNSKESSNGGGAVSSACLKTWGDPKLTMNLIKRGSFNYISNPLKRMQTYDNKASAQERKKSLEPLFKKSSIANYCDDDYGMAGPTDCRLDTK